MASYSFQLEYNPSSTISVSFDKSSPHHAFPFFQSSLLMLHDPVVFRCPIVRDRLESFSLTPSPFTSQPLSSRLFVSTLPKNPSDAISHIVMAFLTKIRTHLVYAIPRATLLPMVPIQIPSILKSSFREPCILSLRTPLHVYHI